MTNATQTLALLFVGSLVLALGVTWGGGTGSSAAFQQQLLAVDTAQVHAVRIERSDAPHVRLERSAGTWSVVPSDTSVSYPASSQAVTRLLGSLPSLEVNAVATRQTDKHPQYGVDSTGTQVTMLGANDEPLGRLIVGRTQIQRPSGGGQQQSPLRRRRRRGTPITYVRSPDAPDVYSIEQPLNAIVNRSVEEWRNKRIWTVAQSDIQQIDFTYPADSSFTMQRATSSDTVATASSAWLSAGDTLSTSEVSSLLRTVSSPEADGFAENTSPDALGEARYTVRLQLSNGASRALRFHPINSGNDYLVTADTYPYVARVRASRWERSVLRGREAFLGSN